MANTVFYQAMHADTRGYVNELLTYLGASSRFPISTQTYWIVYGSTAINGLTDASDVDLLLVLKQGDFKPYRVQENFNGRPITVYVLTENELLSDGTAQAYGGYFTGKLLSPFVAYGCDQKTLDSLYRSINAFMCTLSVVPLKNEVSSSELVREYIVRYLKVCPWYKTYLLKFVKTLGIDDALQLLSKHYTNIHAAKSDKQYVPKDSEELHRHVLRLVARFWSYGAIEHGNKFTFADFYFDKAEQTSVVLDPESVIWNELRDRIGM